MRDDDFNRNGVRSQQRKRQRADKILNISIGIVLLLILLVGAQFLLGGNSDQPVVSDNLEENDKEAIEEDSDTNEPTESTESADQVEKEADKKESQPSDESSNEDSQSDSTTTDQAPELQQGEWEPIGTVQSEPFAAVYDKDHINWEEMTRAFQYATGLGDDMVLWHVGNGGSHESAVGVVAVYSNRTTPYQVRIEWVTNEGWKPVSVEQLDENEYISKYTSTSEESESTEEDSSQ